jgi:hypothetical protein
MKKVTRMFASLAAVDVEVGDELELLMGGAVIKKKGGKTVNFPFFEVQGKTLEAKRKALHDHVDRLFMAVRLEKEDDVVRHKARFKPKG